MALHCIATEFGEIGGVGELLMTMWVMIISTRCLIINFKEHGL